MYKITGTQTRPNTQTAFLTSASDVIGGEVYIYIRENYINTGKIISHEVAVSEDQLTMTSTRLWATESDFNDFMADAYIVDNFINPGNAFMDLNSITRTRTAETV
jgi:hypothetical protein